MTRTPTLAAGIALGTVAASYAFRRSLRRSIRDGTLMSQLVAEANRIKAAADARAAAVAAANAPDEVEVIS